MRAPLRLPTSLLAALFLSLNLVAPPPGIAGVPRPKDDGLAPLRVLTAADLTRAEAKAARTTAEQRYLEMSPMGAAAAGLVLPGDPDQPTGVALSQLRRGAEPFRALLIGGNDIIVHGSNDIGLQSETTIAANADGSVLIAGYNDGRGFSTSPVSLSGVARSTDGGATWNEVPVGPGGAGTLPSVAGGQVFGDPDVKFDPTRSRFVYSSIYVRPSDGLQGMCIHYSNADGSAWTGPIEVTPSFVSGQAADKEFIDVNPATGRIILTWSMFSASPVRILSTYSDDLGATWSPAATIYASPSGGGAQASVPRFRPGATNATSTVYVVWRTSAPVTGARNLGFARSTDGGATWSPTSLITTDYNIEDQIPGIDRVNTSPSMAVDYASGRVFVVYQANNTVGEGDVAVQVSNDGVSFSPRMLISSDPGNDRAQFYPAVTVDQSSGRAHVIWYDQDPLPSGDVTELMHTYSDDGGATWSRPTPLFDRPFHAGYGNDTSQPNVGDYMQAVAQNGLLHTLSASTNLVSRFDEGQPTSASLFSPDSYFDRLSDATQVASLRLGPVSFAEGCPAGANGQLDPGETGDFALPLENYVGNPNDSPATITGIVGTLTTATPGVTILGAVQPYPDASPLTTVSNAAPFRVQLAPGFVAGTYVDLLLQVSSAQGSIELPYRLATGTAGAAVALINENFDAAAMPALPSGWTFSNAGGLTSPAWVTATTIPGGGIGSPMAFHANSASTKFHRLFSPVVTVPTPASGTEAYVTIDFDLASSTEDDPSKAYQAWDGLTLRITDQTSGQLLRSVLAEAFAEQIRTGTRNHFPKHTVRNSNASYFQDMSVWAGYSQGFTHVSMKLAGAGLVGRAIQLRFEYTEDGAGVCTDDGYPGPCGVGLDNVVVRYVPVTTQFIPTASTVSLTSDLNPAYTTQTVTFTAGVTPASASGTVEFFEGATSLGTAPVTGGVAALPLATLAAGSHLLHAVYSGDACDSGARSDDYKQDIVDLATPTLMTLFTAEVLADGIEVRWQFGQPELFTNVRLERAATAAGPWSPVAGELRIEGTGTAVVDRAVTPGTTYFYRITAVASDGRSLTFGPMTATAGSTVTEFAISGVAPSPSAGLTRIGFTVPREAQVRLGVLDVQGREVALLASGSFRPGRYEATWDGRATDGPASPGIYFVRFQAAGRSLVHRIVIAR